MVHQLWQGREGLAWFTNVWQGRDGLVWFTSSGKDEMDSHGSTTLERIRETVGQETDAGCWSLA